MSEEELKTELDRLRSENAALKKGSSTRRTVPPAIGTGTGRRWSVLARQTGWSGTPGSCRSRDRDSGCVAVGLGSAWRHRSR